MLVPVVVMIMVVIIPVAVRVPTMIVFVPPLVCVCPAVLSRFVQLLARVYHLSAFPTVVFGGFVQPMIGFCDAPLARRATGARLPVQDRLHSPPLARSSAPLCPANVRPHPSANCNSGESPLHHSQCEPATWPCLRPRKLPLDRHA